MVLVSFPDAEDVTLVSRAVSGQDSYGNDVYGEMQTVIPGCPVWPRSSSENVQGGDLTVVGVATLLPSGTDVAAVDAVLIGGLRYEVDGEPAHYRSPFTNLDPGVLLNLRRVTG